MTVSELGQVERGETLTEQTYARLRRALMAGRLSPGEKVTVRGIASALEVSLTPAREAIGRLIAERALDLKPNRTVTVPLLTRSKYRELLQIRLLLEGLAAERAAANFDDARVAGLERIHEDMAEAIGRSDSKAALEKNEDFHFCIYQRSEMPTLVSIIEGLWLQIGPALNLLTPNYQRSRRGLRHHGEALEAARARDGKALRRAIEQDLTDGARYVEQTLQD